MINAIFFIVGVYNLACLTAIKSKRLLLNRFMHLRTLLITAFVLLTISTWMGCFSVDEGPDVSQIEVTVERVDFDDLFLSMEKTSPQMVENFDAFAQLRSDIETLKSAHPQMTEIYIKNVMGFQKPRDTTELYLMDINGFLNSEHPHNLKAKVDSVFGNRSNLDQQFERVFQYLKHYFPAQQIPLIYYLISEFSYASFIFPIAEDRDALAVGLDFFLGSDYPYKEMFPTNPAFSHYLSRTFTPDYVVKKSMDVLLDDMIGYANGPRMIDEMIKNGKQQYILKKLMPTTPDSILWEFTDDQMNWVKENELNIYAYLTSENLLYSTDQLKFQKFVSPSPNSPGMPESAPGRTANYIGYKMIEAYMIKTGATLEALIKTSDTQEIINTARYRPDI